MWPISSGFLHVPCDLHLFPWSPKAPSAALGAPTWSYRRSPRSPTAARRDGWFHTGDLAHGDSDGYYWFTVGKKEIIRGGSNISPQEVEAALYELAAVSEAAVAGRPGPVWGEVVAAHFVARPGAS